MTNKAGFNFQSVENLRKSMLITTRDMADLLGVSRMSYYSWLRDKPLSEKSLSRMKPRLRKMLQIVADHGWPRPEEIVMTSKDRAAKLRGLMGLDETDETDEGEGG